MLQRLESDPEVQAGRVALQVDRAGRVRLSGRSTSAGSFSYAASLSAR